MKKKNRICDVAWRRRCFGGGGDDADIAVAASTAFCKNARTQKPESAHLSPITLLRPPDLIPLILLVQPQTRKQTHSLDFSMCIKEKIKIHDF